MKSSLENNLQSFGLSLYEAKVFAAVYLESPASASMLAKKTNLSRSTVYTVLHSLSGKGLIGTTYKNEVKQFQTAGNTALEQYLAQEKQQFEKKQTAFTQIKKQLDVLSESGDKNIPQTIFFEGKAGLKRIYMSMLRNAPTCSVIQIIRDEFVWQDDWQFIFEKDWRSRVDRIKKEKQITTKLLINPSKTEQTKRAYYKKRTDVSYRFLSKNSPVSNFALYIIADMVSILSLEQNNLLGIKIVNQNLADNYTSLFQNLWQNKKKTEV